jgi:hypothetical protein
VTVFVKHKGEMVLVKRSSEVRTHHGKWDTIAGYLDQMKPIRMKVLEGIQEECGTGESQVSSIRAGKVYECVARAYCHYEPPSMFGPVRTNIRLVDRLCW